MTAVAGLNKRLAALTAAGTAVWLDEIRRSLTRDGELARLVQEDSLRGVTSNPAIFEKAIVGSPDYHVQIETLARAGAGARAIYEAIAVKAGLSAVTPTAWLSTCSPSHRSSSRASMPRSTSA